MAAVVKFGDLEMAPGRMPARALRALLDSEMAPDFERMELIEGVLPEMPPSKTRHGKALVHLASAVLKGLPRGFDAVADPTVYLGEFSMLAPDIVVARAGDLIEDTAPEALCLAIEISDTKLARDLREKARVFGANGLPELWVIDLENRLLHVHRDPGAEGYASIAAQPWGTPAAPLFAPDLTLTLADTLKDLE